MLIWLSLLAISAQLSFYAIHGKVSEIIDTLVQGSITTDIFHSVILIPIISFILIQIASYILFITAIWFVSVSFGEFFKFSVDKTYFFGLFFWLACCCALLTVNNYFFYDSFFPQILLEHGWYNDTVNTFLVIVTCTFIFFALVIAFLNLFLHRRHLISGGTLLGLGTLFLLSAFHSHFLADTAFKQNKNLQPNIIFIGLDSLRSDFVGYFGNKNLKTPNIDSILTSSTIFTESYTPLARTFPSWISILTGKYPKHSLARNNLTQPDIVFANDNLAKHLRKAGYETIYASDEKRFSNITEDYGFDKIIGPKMGINDFLLGSLNDFPLTNLLINTSIGKLLFPYNYANRAAAITYQPDKFLDLVKSNLSGNHNKPVFLSIHFCISHWPYTWAHDGQGYNFNLKQRYSLSIEALDKQLGTLLSFLKKEGLLENTLVVLLSDHGTTLGLPGDRNIAEENFVGDKKLMTKVSRSRYDTNTPHELNTNKLVMNTSYGQGTDVLSLKQYHVLLAFKGFGLQTKIRNINSRTSLIDIAPTILDYLKLPSLNNIDGISLASPIFQSYSDKNSHRPLFLESGYSIAEIEKNDIFIEKVLKHAIGAYIINPHNGLVYMNPLAQKSINQSKQRAVILDDWMLAYYPSTTRLKLEFPPHSKVGHFKPFITEPYYVLLNLKTGKWGIGLTSSLTKTAPMKELLNQFNQFYGKEIQ